MVGGWKGTSSFRDVDLVKASQEIIILDYFFY